MGRYRIAAAWSFWFYECDSGDYYRDRNRAQEKSGMKRGQHFRRGFRYREVTGEEHPGDCGCGRCQTFVWWCEKRLYGPGHVERGGIVYTPGTQPEIRMNQR